MIIVSAEAVECFRTEIPYIIVDPLVIVERHCCAEFFCDCYNSIVFPWVSLTNWIVCTVYILFSPSFSSNFNPTYLPSTIHAALHRLMVFPSLLPIPKHPRVARLHHREIATFPCNSRPSSMIWNRSPPTTYLQNLVLFVLHEPLPAGTAHIMLFAVSLPCLCLSGCVGPTWCTWPASNFARQFRCPRFWRELNMPAFPKPSSLAENISDAIGMP